MNIYKGFTVLVILFLVSCKSEFETLRTSNQPEKVYKAANKYYDNKEYDRAVALYDVVIQFYRGRKEAEDLFYKYAYAHYHLGDYILASTYFKNFANTFGNSPNKQEAEYMAAYSNYRLSPNFKLDQSYTEKAIEAFEQYINAYPDTERAQEATRLIDEMRRKLEQKSFEQGNLYYKIGQFQAAVTAFQNTLKDFPESKKAEEIRYLTIKSSHTLAENSVVEKKEERYNQCIEFARAFQKKYPKSKWNSDVKKIIQDSTSELNKIKK